MLTITIEGGELHDPVNNEFIILPPAQIDLEHSLVSLSKWEQKHKVPFLAGDTKSEAQVLDYVRCMVLNPEFDPQYLHFLSGEDTRKIDEYINSPESATTFTAIPAKQGPSETITSELIYYWMVAFNIPWEAENWHLNRLFSLIRVCNVKQNPPKPRSAQEIAMWQREENARRLAASGKPG